MNTIGLKHTTFYLIRHIATQQVMPLCRRNRGYSWWNPNRKDDKESRPKVLFLEIPRLLKSEKQAKKVIAMWRAFPNGKHSFYQSSYDGEYNDSIDFKDDGRKKEDLEVIKVRMVKI